MKKLIFTLISMMFIGSAVAQTNNTGKKENKRMDPKEMVEKRTKEMTEKYALSTEQAAKVKALNEKYMGKPGGHGKGQRPNMKDGKRPEPPKDGKAPNSNMQGKGPKGGPRGGMPNMEEYNKELQKIMNKTQYKAYTADMEKMKAERKAKHSEKKK